jgi:hypothetical protein
MHASPAKLAREAPDPANANAASRTWVSDEPDSERSEPSSRELKRHSGGDPGADAVGDHGLVGRMFHVAREGLW